jgi:hypothetical protein
MGIAALAELLHETSVRHGSFEAVAPPHNWWDSYAAYMDARERGDTPGRGLRGRRALHGRRQARRRRVPINLEALRASFENHTAIPRRRGFRDRPGTPVPA